MLQLANREVQFKIARNFVGRNLFLSHEGVCHAILTMYFSFYDEYKSQIFMDVNMEGIARPMSIATFSEHQTEHCQTLCRHLVETWRRKVSDLLLDNTQGHFNFYETSREGYEAGALRKFLGGLQIRMRDLVLSVVKNSLQQWDRFAQDACAWNEEAAGESESEGGALELSPSPLFIARLTFSENGSIMYEPSCDDVKKTFTDAVQRLVEGVRSVATVDSELMTLMQLPILPILDIGNSEM